MKSDIGVTKLFLIYQFKAFNTLSIIEFSSSLSLNQKTSPFKDEIFI
jgi:hypothetical protein